MKARVPSGIDIMPFLFKLRSLSHAKKLTQTPTQHQQLRGLEGRARARNKSSVSSICSAEPSLPGMAKRGQIVSIPASAERERSAYIPILDAINSVTIDAMQRMCRPTAAVLRFTLMQDGSPSAVTKRLSEHCLRKSGVRPGYVWVREVSERDYDGLPSNYGHFHVVLIFDRQAHGIGTVVDALKKLEKRAWLESWHISDDGLFKRKIVVHDLRNPKSAKNYQYHVGYLAKTLTKINEPGQRIFGRSKIAKRVDDEVVVKPAPKKIKEAKRPAKQNINLIVPRFSRSNAHQIGPRLNLPMCWCCNHLNALFNWKCGQAQLARPPP